MFINQTHLIYQMASQMTTTNDNQHTEFDMSTCSNYYANLRLGVSIGGRGVYTKKPFVKGEIIEIAPFICDTTFSFQDYVFQSHLSDYKSVLVLGYGSIYNHSKRPNTKYKLASTENNNLKMFMIYYANQNIDKNEELTINYGSSWWSSRDIKAKKLNKK